MRQFFEQYGVVALGILALIVLIAMITPVGNIIKTSLQGTAQTFSTKMDNQVDTMTDSMAKAFDSATEYVYIADDGKAYIKGELYTGWNGDKAYLNGIEQVIQTNGYMNPNLFFNGVVLGFEESKAYAIINSYKIDGKDVGKVKFTFRKDIPFFVPKVTTFEAIINCPKEYEIRFRDTGVTLNPQRELIGETDSTKTFRFTGVIIGSFSGGYTDLGSDDFDVVLA